MWLLFEFYLSTDIDNIIFYLMDYKDGSFLFCLEWADVANEKAVAAAQK